jgi:hypothetical protein
MLTDLYRVCDRVADRLGLTEEKIYQLRTQIQNLKKNLESGKTDPMFVSRLQVLEKNILQAESDFVTLEQKLETYYNIFEYGPSMDEVSDN